MGAATWAAQRAELVSVATVLADSYNASMEAAGPDFAVGMDPIQASKAFTEIKPAN